MAYTALEINSSKQDAICMKQSKYAIPMHIIKQQWPNQFYAWITKLKHAIKINLRHCPDLP